MDLLIKNGTIVTAKESYKADVAVNDGKIVAIGSNLDFDADKVVDAEGKLVLPGAIDVHTHLAMPFGGPVSADSYLAGTRAAACGGVTTVFDYPVQHSGETIMGLINSKKEVLEKEACVDYAFHCCITDLNGGEILDKEGKTSAWYHYLSRPEFVEAEADKRAVHWATHLDAPLYIVHMADKEGLEECIKAKTEGHELYIETCPQYLEFTCDVYKREDGRNFVCSPPMKGKESQDALWTAIKSGTIDTVATDHCPFQSYEKDWGKDDFTKIPNGCAGIENLYPYMLDAANSGKISFERAVELCSTNPAKIFGCDDKGSIEIGKDADIVIYDKDKDFTISVNNMHSDCDHTIWEGKKLHGYPVQTYLRGSLVYDNGDFVGTPGNGKYVKRSTSK